MENINKIAEELRLQIAEDLMIGSIKTSRQTYIELQTKDHRHIAQSYVETYANDLYNKSNLFWSNIDRTISTLTNYHKEAKSYLELDRYQPQTHHVAKCLYFTSLSYIMTLVYFGLLQKQITLEHLQQLQVISSDEKGLGLQLAGFNIDKYNSLLSSVPHSSTSTRKDTDNDSKILDNDRNKLIWKTAQDAGYIDNNKQWIESGHTMRERAIVAHELGTRLGVPYDAYFSKLWKCKSMSSAYCQARSEDKDRISKLFEDTLRSAGFSAS